MASSSSQHPLLSSSSSFRPMDLADSVVPQGAAGRVKMESRPNQPPLPPNRPAQPPLPPQPSSQSSSLSGAIKREPTGAAPTFSSSNRPPMPPHNSSSSSSRPPSSSSSSYPHPPSSQYPNHHHHVNNNYNQHSRYPPQQTRPGPPLPNRSSQQPPLPPPQHGKYSSLLSNTSIFLLQVSIVNLHYLLIHMIIHLILLLQPIDHHMVLNSVVIITLAHHLPILILHSHLTVMVIHPHSCKSLVVKNVVMIQPMIPVIIINDFDHRQDRLNNGIINNKKERIYFFCVQVRSKTNRKKFFSSLLSANFSLFLFCLCFQSFICSS